MKFLLVRHGETVFNIQHKTQGWCDSPLTTKGIEQAKELAEKLKDINIDHAYCSSSERTIDTAEIILKNRNIDLITDRRLKELNYGLYEGSIEGVKESYIESSNMVGRDFTNVGGENTQMLVLRFSECINEIIKKYPDDCTVLIVSHGAAIYRFLNDFVFQKANDVQIHKEYMINNCEVKVLNYHQGVFSLEDRL